jgi:hypothetical protein
MPPGHFDMSERSVARITAGPLVFGEYVPASSLCALVAGEPDGPRLPKLVAKGDFQGWLISKAGLLARVRLPQKQGLCQVVKAPDFETLSGF